MSKKHISYKNRRVVFNLRKEEKAVVKVGDQGDARATTISCQFQYLNEQMESMKCQQLKKTRNWKLCNRVFTEKYHLSVRKSLRVEFGSI